LKKHLFVVVSLSLLLIISCGKKETAQKNSPDINVKSISSQEEFTKILESSQNKLLVFDLYADWCAPCRMLAPTYNEIAGTHKEKAAFYRVNVDKHPEIAQAFGVRGIPYVVFVKNKEVVNALTGLNPRESYEKVILACGNENSAADCSNNLGSM